MSFIRNSPQKNPKNTPAIELSALQTNKDKNNFHSSSDIMPQFNIAILSDNQQNAEELIAHFFNSPIPIKFNSLYRLIRSNNSNTAYLKLDIFNNEFIQKNLAYTTDYLKCANAIIAIFDTPIEKSTLTLPEWQMLVQQYMNVNAKVLLIANKYSIYSQSSLTFNDNEIAQFAKNWQVDYLIVNKIKNSFDTARIRQAFQAVISQVLDNEIPYADLCFKTKIMAGITNYIANEGGAQKITPKRNQSIKQITEILYSADPLAIRIEKIKAESARMRSRYGNSDLADDIKKAIKLYNKAIKAAKIPRNR